MSDLTEASVAVAAAAASASFTVLAVDDEPNILSALRRMLRSKGYQVQIAASGPDGLVLLEKSPVDVIISDMRMPEMNGAEFLRRSREHAPDAVRILLTGYADISSTIDAVNKGEIFRYLSKPWDDEALLRVLQQGLERKQLERERDTLLATVTRQHDELKTHAALLEQRVAERTQELSAAHERMRGDFTGTVRMLSHILDQRAGLASGCGRAAATMVRAVAPNLGLDANATQDVYHAALLEDLGRVGMPDLLINTPINSLNGSDRLRMQGVPRLAESFLVAMPSLQGAGVFLRHVGERWDGQGDPGHLSAELIPMGARLLRAASDYERLKAGSIDPRRYSEEEARRWLHYSSGKRYDPRVVDAVLGWLERTKSRGTKTPVKALKPGMVLSKDLTAGNVLLVPQGKVLDASLISALAQLERRQDVRLELEIESHEDT